MLNGTDEITTLSIYGGIGAGSPDYSNKEAQTGASTRNAFQDELLSFNNQRMWRRPSPKFNARVAILFRFVFSGVRGSRPIPQFNS